MRSPIVVKHEGVSIAEERSFAVARSGAVPPIRTCAVPFVAIDIVLIVDDYRRQPAAIYKRYLRALIMILAPGGARGAAV